MRCIERGSRDYTPTGVCSNCSGKHVGMLAGAQAIGAAIADYHLPDHPMQVRVKQVVADACGLRDDEVDWSIDGCNLPTPAFSLDRLARLYASLADGADAVETGGGAVTDRVRALARIHHAMTSYPELVAGDGRYCTVLMNALDGQVVGKLGADACYGIGVRASERTRQLGAEGRARHLGEDRGRQCRRALHGRQRSPRTAADRHGRAARNWPVFTGRRCSTRRVSSSGTQRSRSNCRRHDRRRRADAAGP